VLVLALCAAHTRRVSSDRYEPLPGFAQLPGWLWRRTGVALRIAVGVTLVAAFAAAAVLVPSISHSRSERSAREARIAAAQHARVIRELQAEQSPRSGRSRSVAPAGASSHARLDARAGLMADVSSAILIDARRRVAEHRLRGPILRATCERFPRTVGGTPPERDLTQTDGRYACVAVVADIQGSAGGEAGAIGYPYRALVQFDSGRFAYCKISGRPDPIPDPAVTTPRACGGT
jgi:hypothetical protein